MDFGMETAWSGLLTAFIAVVAYMLKDRSDEIDRIQVLLNKTREEMARDYVTRSTLHTDIQRVIDRIEALDAKLDRLMERK
jgi:septal ring factor EnvC (AmiA/AmiB activator)